MNVADLIELSAAQAARKIAAGELSAEELFDAYRARAAADELNCFTWVAPERPAGPVVGEDPAGSADATGAADAPLAGVPLAVKDLFCTEGVPSQSGSRILQGYEPPYTATVVKRLQAAGASLLGKTNQDEFAMGSSNENSAYGPVLNPWDCTRVPGGSSGGSARGGRRGTGAVGAGDRHGRLDPPAGRAVRDRRAQTDVRVGVPVRDDRVRLLAGSGRAADARCDRRGAAARHMVGRRDPCDATSLEFPHAIELPSAERLDGIRLGVPAELTGGAVGTGGAGDGMGVAGEGIEAGVLDSFRAALERAAQLGAEIVESVSLPHAPHALSAYYVLAPAEASSNLARFDGVRYGLRAEGAKDLLEMYELTRHDGFGAEVKRRIMLGTYALSAGYYDAYYGRAQRVRTKIAEDFASAFADVDFIVTPTAPTVAFELGEKTSDPLQMYLNDYCTVPMSLAGIPAISIPCGLSDGLPVGLQFAGPAFSENRLLDAAYALEQAFGFDGSAARV